MNKNKNSDTFYNPKEEFNMIYFDKLQLLAVDKCLKLHKEHKEEIDAQELELIDKRNKFVEACLSKVFTLHKVFDNEYLK
jgi:hypothetical protein